MSVPLQGCESTIFIIGFLSIAATLVGVTTHQGPAPLTRPEAIARSLQQRIDAEALAPGSRLGTKHELTESFAVAPATCNEALRILESRGVVTLRPGPGGGVFVGNPTVLMRLGQKFLHLSGDPVSVADALVVRDALEGPVLFDAVRYRTEADVAELRTLARALTGSRSPRGYLRATWAMHRRIAMISPNPLLREVYCSALEQAESQVRGVHTPEGVAVPGPEGKEVHESFVTTIATGDPAAVEPLIARHRLLVSIPDLPADPQFT